MWCDTEVGCLTRDGGRSAETSPDGGFLDSSHVESEGQEGGKKRNPEADSTWIRNSRGEEWNTSTWPVVNPLTARPDVEKNTLKELDSVVSVVSTCILHDSNRGRNFFQCFVNFGTLWALCLCDIAMPSCCRHRHSTPPPPPPPPPPPTFTWFPEPRAKHRFTTSVRPPPDALSTCEVIYLKNGCCRDCVWYYCS